MIARVVSLLANKRARGPAEPDVLTPEDRESISTQARALLKRNLVRQEADRLLRAHEARERAATDVVQRNLDGAAFILDPTVTQTRPLWGKGDHVLWADGEAMLLVGGDGVGKSTIAQQLILARIGLRPHRFLGFPVAPATQRVLYLAMDRPSQAARSFRRMVAAGDEATLRERLAVWRGPLPVDIGEHPYAMHKWITNEFGSDIGEVHVDSYKDLVNGLSDDLAGSQLNSALQACIAKGIQWNELHHQRKDTNESRGREYTLHDVYGSRWLTAGAGSVFILLGSAGASVVEMRHVKPVMELVRDVQVRHNFAEGRSERVHPEQTAYLALMEAGKPLTVKQIAGAMFGSSEEAFTKKVTRELKGLQEDGLVVCHGGSRGGAGGSSPATWEAKEPE